MTIRRDIKYIEENNLLDLFQPSVVREGPVSAVQVTNFIVKQKKWLMKSCALQDMLYP